MSSRFQPAKTNKTPWFDELTLVSLVERDDELGYKKKTTVSRTVDCTFSDGVARGEFYESMKAGMKAAATAEVWEEDYGGESTVISEGRRYSVLRHYPTGRGTVALILEEEKR